MSTGQNRRQTSLRAFFGYLTLAGIGLGVMRWALATGAIHDAADSIRVLLVIATMATPFAFGAAVGSLVGRRRIGVVIGVLGLLYLLFGRLPWALQPSYTMQVVVPHVAGIREGTSVSMHGNEVGRVSSVEELSDNQIRLTLRLMRWCQIGKDERIVIDPSGSDASIRIEYSFDDIQ